MNQQPRETFPFAIAELRRAYRIALDNTPIHVANGDNEQAKLSLQVAIDCNRAVLALDRPTDEPGQC